jgi:ankyrin repeat protein
MPANPAVPATPPPAAPPQPPSTPVEKSGPAGGRVSQEELQKRRDAARELLKSQGGQGLSAAGGAAGAPPAAPLAPQAAVAESKSLRFEPAELEFGEMVADVPMTKAVTLVNISDKPVTVTRVVPSCGCTTAPAPKDPIPVGGSVEIPITLKPGAKQGIALSKRVTFQIDGEPPVTYVIKGNVAEYVRIEPELINVNTEDPASGKITLKSLDGTPFRVLGVNPAIVAEYGAEPALEHTVQIDWAKWKEAGSGIRLAMSIDHPKLASASVTIRKPLPPRDPTATGDAQRSAPPPVPAIDPASAELIAAARKGDVAAVKAALEKGGKVSDADRASGRNALQWAAGEGKIEVIEALLLAGAALDAEDRTGKTALTIAAERGRADAVKALLKAGAAINHRDRIQGSPLLWAAGLGNPSTVRELIAANADVNVADVNGLTPLLWAAGIGESESVAALLDAKADPATRDRIDGDDALIRAIRSGKPETVKLLIERGAKVDTRNDKGATALLIAASNGSLEKLRMIVEAKADIAVKDNSGRGAIEYANNRIDPEKDAIVKYIESLLAKQGG